MIADEIVELARAVSVTSPTSLDWLRNSLVHRRRTLEEAISRHHTAYTRGPLASCMKVLEAVDRATLGDVERLLTELQHLEDLMKAAPKKL